MGSQQLGLVVVEFVANALQFIKEFAVLLILLGDSAFELVLHLFVSKIEVGVGFTDFLVMSFSGLLQLHKEIVVLLIRQAPL
eukprot:Skav206550  [mRNA]  locus=scaffold547:23645:26768:+ [translate_table: standard]